MQQPQPHSSQHNENEKTEEEYARRIARDKIVRAEKFKANTEKSKGAYVEDDEFFHVTCHLDSSLKDKIAKGEFVELERLLPKAGRLSHAIEDKKVQLVQREGETFTPVADKDNKIGGIRRWDQAFRVYATVSCQSNPHRSAEIWQYVHVINSAASYYVWENIAEYNYVFRQLMASNPERSWAKTYSQMWNIALREPLTKNKVSPGTSTSSKASNWRDRCCWKYNKNRCHDSNCGFDHRCKYCGGWNHGSFECRKRKCESGGGDDNYGRRNQGNGNGSPSGKRKK